MFQSNMLWTAEALALHQKGWTYAAIGREVGRSRERVRQVLSQQPRQLRPESGPTSVRSCVFCAADFASNGRQRLCCHHCIDREQWRRQSRRNGQKQTPHLSRWRTWIHSDDCRLITAVDNG
jgi:hypothetical protein